MGSNDLLPRDTLHPGTRLYLPYPYSPRVEQYVVRWGDTLAGIAARYRTSVINLAMANLGLIQRPDQIVAGWKLQVSRGSEMVCDDPGHCHYSYVILPGDTLASILHRAGTTVSAWMSWAHRQHMQPDGQVTAGYTLPLPPGLSAPAS